MTKMYLNEQIAFLRKQKGLTQEELARELGVSNQAVSKWESAQCCPDLALLPDLAKLFDVSIDELMGYQPADTFENIYLKLKSLFAATPEKDIFSKAFRLSMLLHEAACTKGYKAYIPWDTSKNHGLEKNAERWGFSACSEPEGTTILCGSGMFISDSMLYQTPGAAELRDLSNALNRVHDFSILKVLYALYDLTVHDFSLYVPVTEIASKANLSGEAARKALEAIPVTIVQGEDGQELYRIKDCFMHIPPMLLMLQECMR